MPLSRLLKSPLPLTALLMGLHLPASANPVPVGKKDIFTPTGQPTTLLTDTFTQKTKTDRSKRFPLGTYGASYFQFQQEGSSRTLPDKVMHYIGGKTHAEVCAQFATEIAARHAALATSLGTTPDFNINGKFSIYNPFTFPKKKLLVRCFRGGEVAPYLPDI